MSDYSRANGFLGRIPDEQLGFVCAVVGVVCIVAVIVLGITVSSVSYHFNGGETALGGGGATHHQRIECVKAGGKIELGACNR